MRDGGVRIRIDHEAVAVELDPGGERIGGMNSQMALRSMGGWSPGGTPTSSRASAQALMTSASARCFSPVSSNERWIWLVRVVYRRP